MRPSLMRPSLMRPSVLRVSLAALPALCLLTPSPGRAQASAQASAPPLSAFASA